MFARKLANLGKRVIVAGLDTDYRGRPFEPMPRLLAIAEEITKLLAILACAAEIRQCIRNAGGKRRIDCSRCGWRVRSALPGAVLSPTRHK